VPGVAANVRLLEAVRAHDLPFVLAYGDAAACVMAAVTGDLTGAPGAALAGPGPGVAAAVTGVAHAALDRSPLIFLTDHHPATLLACKASLRVEAASAAHWVAHAGQLAMTPPRGPVHLDVSPDVAGAAAVPVATACRPEPLPPPVTGTLDAAAKLLASASRPVLVAGLGCRAPEGAAWLRALAEALPAPVLATRKGKGAVPDPHPLRLGVLPGGHVEARLLSRADLIVTLGLDAVAASPWRGRRCPSGRWPPSTRALTPTTWRLGGTRSRRGSSSSRTARRRRASLCPPPSRPTWSTGTGASSPSPRRPGSWAPPPSSRPRSACGCPWC